jgi:hypothetical protein
MTWFAVLAVLGVAAFTVGGATGLVEAAAAFLLTMLTIGALHRTWYRR